jgi:hypothetical protein
LKKLLFLLLLAGGSALWLLWPASPKGPVSAPLVLQASFQPAAALVVSKIAFDVKFETDRDRNGQKLPFRSFVTAPASAQVTLDFAEQPLLATRTGTRLALVAPPPQLDFSQISVATESLRAFAIDKSFWQNFYVSERRVLAEAALGVGAPARAQAQAHFETNRASFEAAARTALADFVAAIAREAAAEISGVDVEFRVLTSAERAAASVPLEKLLRPGS